MLDIADLVKVIRTVADILEHFAQRSSSSSKTKDSSDSSVPIDSGATTSTGISTPPDATHSY